ncbi:uncharacterized protein BDW70DRAFT_139215 [Aspergillus foveolatus]|uniref:uncharacterized protein n=1 Tax=Aspergillus foveolatus TaxID=210207 RepID=UPI003CCDF0D6
MKQLPTPPASRQSSEVPDTDLKQLHIDDPTPDPLESLDALLEKYLHLLDKHQRLQHVLASKLSSGFLSLAHANYTCPPGRRYGADYYDERMKASRRVILRPPSSTDREDSTAEIESPPPNGVSSKGIFSIEFASSNDEEEQPDTDESSGTGEKALEKALEQEPLKNGGDNNAAEPTAASQDSSEASETKTEAEAGAKSGPIRRRPRTLDPIKWFGILVPPSLRSAQKSFTEAVEGSLPELAGIVVEMQAAEKEITELRRRMGRE